VTVTVEMVILSEAGVIPSRQARDPQVPGRELSIGTMKILRLTAQDDEEPDGSG